ncbi:MAG TPA: hypothetical protein VKU41_23385 [Polyangiaceae bacterium]|nr:hypothetical protein [Polyangiaceae bacterium]
MHMALRVWWIRTAVGPLAAIAGAVSCLSSEDIDLGRNVDTGGSTGTSSATPPIASADGAAAVNPVNCSASQELPAACDAGVPDLNAPGADDASNPVIESGMVVPPAQTDEAGASGGGDGGAGASFCVKNPSFEPMTNSVTTGNAPPYWQLCPNFNLPTLPILPVINPSICSMSASDGMDYVGLTVGSYGPATDASESMGTLLCSPLLPGTTYSVSIDLGIAAKTLMNLANASSGLPAVLELYGSKTPCGKDELLWRTPSITNQDSWTKDCTTFTPTQTALYLTLVPNAPPGSTFAMGEWSYLVVDHIQSGVTCK